ncbi:MAG: DUF3395 domain-containing protein [Victivallaceae bacterium]
MKSQAQSLSENFKVEIRRGRIRELSIYEVSDTELNMLAHGGTGTIMLTFAVFLLSVAISFTIALLSASISPGKTYTFFMASTIIGYSIGFILLIFWIWQFKGTSNVVRTIRSRIIPSGHAENLTETTVLPENPQTRFFLISAHYGTEKHQIDVTDRVAALITDQGLVITASNNIAGDPHYGGPKTLKIRYRSHDNIYIAEVKEGETIKLPEK